jgi:hypothetical protein
LTYGPTAWKLPESRRLGATAKGLIMKKMGLALALVACVSMTVVPVAPSFAAAPPAPKAAQQQLVDHAARGEAIILSQAQLDRLATTNKALHAKIVKAHQTGSLPKLTASEKKMLRTMTAGNLDAFKAGWDPATVWIVVAVVAAVLILFTPIFCPIFTFLPACGRYAPAAVTARG